MLFNLSSFVLLSAAVFGQLDSNKGAKEKGKKRVTKDRKQNTFESIGSVIAGILLGLLFI